MLLHPTVLLFLFCADVLLCLETHTGTAALHKTTKHAAIATTNADLILFFESCVDVLQLDSFYLRTNVIDHIPFLE